MNQPDVRAIIGQGDPEEDRAASIRFACPFCGAMPGQPCVKDDGSGWVLLLPHYSRIPDRP